MKTNESNRTDNLQQSAPATTSSSPRNLVRDVCLKCAISLLVVFIDWVAIRARNDYVTTQQALDGIIGLMNDRLPTSAVPREASSLAVSR